MHSVKEQLFNYIVLCFIKLQILARISSFSLLRSQYNFCSGLRTWKFWQILLILLNISVLITGHVEHDIRKCFSSSISPDVQRRQSLSCRRAPWYRPLSICNLCDEQTWGQLLANVIDYITITLQFSWLHYITITLQFSWLHYITITSIFKCNRLHYNYFVNVIDYITDYIWCHDNQCIFKFVMLLLFVSNFCFFVCLLVCVQ